MTILLTKSPVEPVTIPFKGGGGADTILGGDGNDRIVGGLITLLPGPNPYEYLSDDASGDRLEGGLGDDTYVVGSGDIIIENFDEGVDTVEYTGNPTVSLLPRRIFSVPILKI